MRSAAPGRVTFAGFASGWGLVVTVESRRLEDPLRASLPGDRRSGRVGRGRRTRGPRRRDRVCHRPAPALRGHRAGRERGPRARPLAVERAAVAVEQRAADVAFERRELVIDPGRGLAVEGHGGRMRRELLQRRDPQRERRVRIGQARLLEPRDSPAAFAFAFRNRRRGRRGPPPARHGRCRRARAAGRPARPSGTAGAARAPRSRPSRPRSPPPARPLGTRPAAGPGTAAAPGATGQASTGRDTNHINGLAIQSSGDSSRVGSITPDSVSSASTAEPTTSVRVRSPECSCPSSCAISATRCCGSSPVSSGSPSTSHRSRRTPAVTHAAFHSASTMIPRGAGTPRASAIRATSACSVGVCAGSSAGPGRPARDPRAHQHAEEHRRRAEQEREQVRLDDHGGDPADDQRGAEQQDDHGDQDRERARGVRASAPRRPLHQRRDLRREPAPAGRGTQRLRFQPQCRHQST